MKRDQPNSTHHADFEGIEQVKGQCSNQVNNEPRGQVVDANLSSVKDHLARFTDISGAEIENDVWKQKQNKKAEAMKYF